MYLTGEYDEDPKRISFWKEDCNEEFEIIEERKYHSEFEIKVKVKLLFGAWNVNAEKCSKECDEFNLNDKKGKILSDILIGVGTYGIREKEGKAYVFGGMATG